MFDPVRDAWTSDQLAARIGANQAELRERECEALLLAAAWADVHGVDTTAPGYEPLVERACVWGGEGTPEVSEYAVHELGALHGVSGASAEGLIADALDLRHRLPRLWARVRAGSVRAWQARAVAQATHGLPQVAAGLVDAAVTRHLGVLPWARFQRILAAAVLEADPASAAERAERARTERDVTAFDGEHGLKVLVAKAAAGDVTWFLAVVNRLADILAADGDPDPVGARRAKAIGLLAQPARALQLLLDHQTDPSLAEPPDAPEDEDERGVRSLDLARPAGRMEPAAVRPRVVLHFHLSDATLRAGHGVVRTEHGQPETLQQLRDWLRETGCAVQVRPVVDPAQAAAVDSYETPSWLRDLVLTRNPAEVFPYGPSLRRGMDLDHTVPYSPVLRGGPPGQTGLHNLGPLSRRNHRAVTHGRWRRRQPEPGLFLFRSPHGYVFAVTNQGTLTLGCGTFADRAWRAALDGAPGPPPPPETDRFHAATAPEVACVLARR